MDRGKTAAAPRSRRSDALVLDVLYLAGALVLAGLTALTARAAAER